MCFRLDVAFSILLKSHLVKTELKGDLNIGFTVIRWPETVGSLIPGYLPL